MSTDDFQFDRNDSQSDETYTTPISPLSPQEKSPPPPPLLTLLPPIIISSTINSCEQNDEELNSVNEMQTLIQSSNDLTFPLEDSWTFWYFKNDRMCDWKDNLIKITTISTVESFWSVYNHLQSASRLGQGCDYFLFKTHIVRSFYYYY
jgi:translation initiation factor 4E